MAHNIFERLAVSNGGLVAKEGVIIELPQNDLFHDRYDVILTSQMAASNIFLTVAVI